MAPYPLMEGCSMARVAGSTPLPTNGRGWVEATQFPNATQATADKEKKYLANAS
jgi:hypothetical protein